MCFVTASLEFVINFACSATCTVVAVASVSELVWLVQDIGTRSNFGFEMKASLLCGKQ